MTINVIESRSYAAHEIIVQEGEDSDEAFLVRSGSVEVLKRTATGDIARIAVLDAGEIFGEMGLILDRPRSASVRAQTDVILDVVDPACFTSLFEGEVGQKLRPIIQLLCERLRVADARRAELESRCGDGTERLDEPFEALSVYMFPNTEPARLAMQGKDRVEIDKYPFRVGRFDRESLGNLFHLNDLFLTDHEPYQVSPSHFAIFRSHNSCCIQDRGSRCGCRVNGTQVGGEPGAVSRVALKQGRNLVEIGAPPTELSYTIMVEKLPQPSPTLWRKVRGHLGFPH
jgi:CRP-like cAMP-binding protein